MPTSPSTRFANEIATFLDAIAAADDAARRALLTGLYKDLQGAGLSESTAAAIQHQLARATEGAASEETTTHA